MNTTRRLVNPIARAIEAVGLALRPRRPHHFYIVSAAHDAARFVRDHIHSISSQRYDRGHIHHVVIDDASTDGTGDVVSRQLEQGVDYDLQLRRNDQRRGGCANLTAAFRSAPAGSIVLQVDADDWLPDPRVLAYLDMLYQDPDLWMTYNSWVSPDGRAISNSRPVERDVVERRAFRDHDWVTSHLHSFRSELFSHVEDESLIDPATGDFWTAAVDMSHYFPMLELAGSHARHVRRVTYVYNLHPNSLFEKRRAHQLECERRIRALPRYAALDKLEGVALEHAEPAHELAGSDRP